VALPAHCPGHLKGAGILLDQTELSAEGSQGVANTARSYLA